MKIKIFITLLFAGLFISSNAFHSSNIFDNFQIDFYTKIREYKGIKKIIKRTSIGWEVISLFDREGHVLHETNAYKGEVRSDLTFSYTVTDTLAEIRRSDEIYDVWGDTLRIERYYYDSSGQCYQFRVYSSDQDTSRYYSIENFVYKDGMLISYPENTCTYNEKKQLTGRLEIFGTDTTFYTYMYNQHGQQTDFIKESPDTTVCYDGAPDWNKTRCNKIHIQFADFDCHGNWTRSYFITEKEKIFSSERIIEYW